MSEGQQTQGEQAATGRSPVKRVVSHLVVGVGTCKLRNKRVRMALLDDDTWSLTFKRLAHRKRGGRTRVKVTRIHLTDEALRVVVRLYLKYAAEKMSQGG